MFKKIFNDDIPLKKKLYYIICIAGVITSLLATIVSCIAGLSIYSILVSIIALIVILGLFIYTVKSDKYTIAVKIVISFCNLIIFPLLFITSGGVDGGSVFYFILGIIAAVLLIEGIQRIILVTIFLSNYTILIVMAYHNSDLVIKFANERLGMIDLATSFVIVTVFLSFIVSVVVSQYNTAYQKTQKLSEYLMDLSIKDPLTNIYNRRFLLNRLEDLFSYFEHEDTCLSVVLFDIDHFKNINDLYGHIIGDEVLIELSKITKNEIESKDIFGRYGGEEFLLILPGKNTEEAFRIAENIRLKIEESKLHPDIKEKVTISGGVASIGAGIDIEKLVDIADRNLYFAKNNGRNQISKIYKF